MILFFKKYFKFLIFFVLLVNQVYAQSKEVKDIQQGLNDLNQAYSAMQEQQKQLESKALILSSKIQSLKQKNEENEGMLYFLELKRLLKKSSTLTNNITRLNSAIQSLEKQISNYNDKLMILYFNELSSIDVQTKPDPVIIKNLEDFRNTLKFTLPIINVPQYFAFKPTDTDTYRDLSEKLDLLMDKLDYYGKIKHKLLALKEWFEIEQKYLWLDKEIILNSSERLNTAHNLILLIEEIVENIKLLKINVENELKK